MQLVFAPAYYLLSQRQRRGHLLGLIHWGTLTHCTRGIFFVLGDVERPVSVVEAPARGPAAPGAAPLVPHAVAGEPASKLLLNHGLVKRLELHARLPGHWPPSRFRVILGVDFGEALLVPELYAENVVVGGEVRAGEGERDREEQRRAGGHVHLARRPRGYCRAAAAAADTAIFPRFSDNASRTHSTSTRSLPPM